MNFIIKAFSNIIHRGHGAIVKQCGHLLNSIFYDDFPIQFNVYCRYICDETLEQTSEKTVITEINKVIKKLDYIIEHNEFLSTLSMTTKELYLRQAEHLLEIFIELANDEEKQIQKQQRARRKGLKTPIFTPRKDGIELAKRRKLVQVKKLSFDTSSSDDDDDEEEN